MVSRASGRPAYRQIADALREQIASGDYAPGDQLPSERDLMDKWEVSQRTVRVALDRLRAEGRIVSYQGRGVFVREQLITRRLSSDIPRQPGEPPGWYASIARLGLAAASKTTVSRVPCPPDIAPWIGVQPGDEVTVRDRVMATEGKPPELLAVSYIPQWVVDRAPRVAQSDAGPGGIIARLEDAGFNKLHFLDVITSRMPSQRETELLDLRPGTPVTVVHGATYDQDGEALYDIELIVASDRLELAYRYGEIPDDD